MQNIAKSAPFVLCFLFLIHGSVLNTEAALRMCTATKQCPDSGTICKAAPPGTTILPNYPLQFSEEIRGNGGTSAAFDPLTDTEKLAEGLLSDAIESDPSSSESASEDSLNQAQSDPHNVSSLTEQPSNSRLNLDQVTVGTILRVYGWKCEVIKINLTRPDGSKRVGSSVVSSSSVMAVSSSSSFVITSTDAASFLQSDADSSAVNISTKLKEGKIVSLGPITCKITGAQSKNLPDEGITGQPLKASTTKIAETTTDLLSNPLTTTGASTSRTQPSKTERMKDVVDIARNTDGSTESTVATTNKITTQPTIADLVSSTKASKFTSKPVVVGRCVCDNDRRFACISNEECFMRFQNKAILCFESTGCPSEIGTTGYCRMSSTAEVVNDAI